VQDALPGQAILFVDEHAGGPPARPLQIGRQILGNEGADLGLEGQVGGAEIEIHGGASQRSRRFLWTSISEARVPDHTVQP